MKRWLALILALLLLLPCGAGPAEEEGPTNADLQETLASEGKVGAGTVAENLRFFADMLKDEQFMSLLRIDDVREISTEIVWKVLAWLYENRDVTMKILAELGVTEEDRRCVAKLWDSAERLSEAGKAYNESEAGKQLLEATHALLNDPDIQKSFENFMAMASSEDIALIINAIADIVQEGSESDRPEGQLSKEAVDRQLNRSSLIGILVYRLFDLLEDTEWFSSSVPKLVRNENLWRWLDLLTDSGSYINQALEKEFRLLADDPEMVDFANRTGQQLLSLLRIVNDLKKEADALPEEDANKEETP